MGFIKVSSAVRTFVDKVQSSGLWACPAYHLRGYRMKEIVPGEYVALAWEQVETGAAEARVPQAVRKEGRCSEVQRGRHGPQHAFIWYGFGPLIDLGSLGGPSSCADGPLDVGRPIPCCRRMYTREQIRFSSLARQSECEAVRQANSRAKCPAKSGSRATGRTISTRPGISSSTSPATEGWVEIDHPPPARVAMQGRPVVHLARVHHDHVAGRGLDVSNPAP